MTTTLRRLMLGALLASTLATPALAGVLESTNLTGVWAGEMKCKLFDGDDTQTVPLQGTLFVLQLGPQLVLVTDLFLVGNCPGCPTMVAPQGEEPPGIIGTMCGVSLPKNPTTPDVGVGTISPVGGDGSIITGEEAELQVVALKTKTFPPNSKGETGKLTGKGILLPGPVVGSCRWKFVRVDPVPVPLDTSFCLNDPV